MSKLHQRFEQLNKLKTELKDGPKDRKITIYSYIQLLDYHIALIKELDELIDDVHAGNEERVMKWYKERVSDDTPKAEPEDYEV